MNTKTTLLVLLIAAGIVTYFVLYEMNPAKTPIGDTDDPSQPTIGQPLFAAGALPQDKVKLMRLSRDGEPEAVVEREDKHAGEWNQTAPVHFAMQSYQVSDILAAAAGLRYSSTFKPADKKLKLDEMGLAPPKATLTLEGDGVTKTILTLGSRTAAGRAYATLGPVTEASTIYIVDDRLHEMLSKKISELRSQALPVVTVGSTRRVTLTQGGSTVTLVSKDNRWTLTEPVTGRADRNAVAMLVSALGAASIDRFVEDNPASLSQFGLDKPAIVLTTETVETTPIPPKTDAKPDDSKLGKDISKALEHTNDVVEKTVTHKLAIGAATDLDNTAFFAMWDDAPVVFALRKADVEKFQKKPDDLRDPSITAASRTDIKEITLDRPDAAGKIHFTLDQGKWVFGDPKPSFTLDAAQLDALVDSICKVRAVSYVALKEPLAAPLATVTMAVNQAEPEVLVIRPAGTGDKDKDKLLVVRGNETTGYIVNRIELLAALEPALTYRNRNVIDAMPDAIASIKLTRPGIYAATYEFVRQAPEAAGPPLPGAEPKKPEVTKAGDWNLEGTDREAFAQLLASITPLRATKWLSETPAKGPNDPTIELKLTDGKAYSIVFHAALHAATIAGVDKSFEIEPTVIAAVNAELRDKVVLKLEPDQISAVKAAEWTLKRDKSGKFTIDAGTLDEEKAAALYNTLATLQAVRFVDPSRATGEPNATLTFTATGKSQTLKVWTPPQVDAIAQLGGKTFTLAPESAAALTAKPVK